MKSIAFTNQKGGVGKSTTAGNVAYYLSLENQVVLIDNGKIKISINPESESFGFSEVRVKCSEDKVVAGPLCLKIDTDKTKYTTKGTHASECVIEESGPLRVVVLLKGKLGNDYEWQTRLFIHAGEPAIRAEHTIAGLGDKEIDRIEQICLEYDTGLEKDFDYRVAGENTTRAGGRDTRSSHKNCL